MYKIENILLFIYGCITVSTFLLMLYFGGLLNSFETVLYHEISFLISPYSLFSEVTIPLYQLYNLHLLLFSLILLLRVPNIFAKLGALYLAGSTVIGLLLIQFPMDPIQLGQSIAGKQHILVIVIQGITLACAIVLLGRGFTKKLQVLSDLSYGLSLLILLGGLIIGIFALMSMRAYVGFIEKLPIFAFLFWIVITSVWFVLYDKRIKYGLPKQKQIKKRKHTYDLKKGI